MARADLVPTRSKLLELRREHEVVREGYEFLDKKRILLATEIRKWLERYDELRTDLLAAHEAAVVSLAEAIARHGVLELEAMPAAPFSATVQTHRLSALFGIALIDVDVDASNVPDLPPMPNRTPEARRCRARFSELTALAIELSAVSTNLHRLMQAYRRAERRTRALEDVILPELERDLHVVAEHLEAEEREEAVRVRLQRDAPGRGST